MGKKQMNGSIIPTKTKIQPILATWSATASSLPEVEVAATKSYIDRARIGDAAEV